MEIEVESDFTTDTLRYKATERYSMGWAVKDFIFGSEAISNPELASAKRKWLWNAQPKAFGTVVVHFTGEEKPWVLAYYDPDQPYEGAGILGKLPGKGFVPVRSIDVP